MVVQENSGRSSNEKCAEKLPEIYRMGRESPGLRHFQQMFIVYSLLIIVYSLLISVYSLLIIFYSLLIIVYSLLIIFYSLLILVHYLLIIFLFYIFLKFGDRMPLFLFIFHIFVTYIHSFNHIHTLHLSVAIRRGSSPSSHRWSAQWEKPPWGAERGSNSG